MKLSINNTKKNEINNAAKQQQGRPKGNDVEVHEVDVMGLMGALKANGHAKLSDHFKDAEVVEPIEEIKPEPKAAPAPKKEVKLKRKVTLKAKAAAPKAETAPKASAYSVVLLPTKDGGQWPKLYGFKSEEDAKAVADKLPKSVTASWDYGPNGEGRETKTRHWCLKMGKRYCDTAKQLCAALNSGDKKAIAKAIADSQNVYELAVADGKAAREEKEAERKAAKEAERKAGAKAAATIAKAAQKAAPKAKPETKSYSEADVAAMLSAIAEGKAIPAPIRKLMKVA